MLGAVGALIVNFLQGASLRFVGMDDITPKRIYVVSGGSCQLLGYLQRIQIWHFSEKTGHVVLPKTPTMFTPPLFRMFRGTVLSGVVGDV